MIVKMRRVYVVARRRERDRLLASLRELGVIHLTPVDAAGAVAEEGTLTAIGHLDRAIQVLSAIEPQGAAPEIHPGEAAEQTLQIERESAEQQSRLGALHRRMDELSLWGEMHLEDLETIREAGVAPQFFSVPTADLEKISAGFVHEIAALPGRRTLAGVVGLDEEAELPEGAEEIEPPRQDRPTIRAEAAEIDAQLAEGSRRLAELAHCVEGIRQERVRMAREAEFAVASRSGLADEDLFALQGWAPAERAETLSADLARLDMDAAVESSEPTEDDTPPTLIRYPAWARPIKGLFDILGTLPGYREMDLSPFFIVALPVFAAMLIGDAGYGLIFMLPGLLMYRKMAAKAGSAGVQLLIVMGAATLIWGVLTGNYFGISPANMASGTGPFASLGRALSPLAVLWDADPEKARVTIIKISFLFGCIHLTLAHLRRMAALLPDIRALAELGWAVFLWGMLGVIWVLFFGKVEPMPVPMSLVWVGLGAGLGLAVLFACPSRNPAKMLAMGLASAILPALGAFSDTMSYIRLMAVGLASFYIAAAFNGLGTSLAEAATWFAAAPIIAFGHALNIGLAVIAIFAHGVRLNMLEFSNNAGVQWAGYAYEPFARELFEES